MITVLVRHKVKDYPSWKAQFDAHAAARKAAGSQGGQVLRSAADPNELVLLLSWSDVESARRFGESPGLREAMERAGVVDRPDIYLLETADRPAF